MQRSKVQRVIVQPINLIFRFLQSKARIQVWLFEQTNIRLEGQIIGFDEYMNLVLDDAEEVWCAVHFFVHDYTLYILLHYILCFGWLGVCE